MLITIAEKLKPFDHTLGTICLLPGSTLAVEIFPTLICVYDSSKVIPELLTQIKTNIKGPVKGFTVQLNIEKGNVLVFGNSQNGFFRYRITAPKDEKGVCIHIEKNLDSNLDFKSQHHNFSIFKEEGLKTANFPRLSLGMHKSQDWTLVKRRFDLKEIFPLWLALGSNTPQLNNPLSGTASLLQSCHLDRTLKSFEILFSVGFRGLLFPTLIDSQHQGIEISKPLTESSPLSLLSEGAKLITALFITYQNETISILPALPYRFHSGRFLHFRCGNLGLLDLEWSKKLVRRVILFAENDSVIKLKWQKEIKRFQFQEGSCAKKKLDVGAEIQIRKGKTYYFDRFEK